MTARFEPLRNDCIDLRGSNGFSLIKIRRCRQEHDSGSAKCLDPLSTWETKVEADNGGSFRDEYRKLGVIRQEALINLVEVVWRFRPIPCEFGPQPGEPSRLASFVRDRRLMAEYIHIEGTIRPAPNPANH